MARRNDHTAGKSRTVLGGETKFSGVLRFQESLKIDGLFQGTIESPGHLTVESGAEVVADISVGTLVVGGVVHGDVKASKHLELLPGGIIDGDVRSPSLAMAEGSGIRGRCEMLADPSGIDIFSMPLERLKKTLTRVG